jgi:hypothetical protein
MIKYSDLEVVLEMIAKKRIEVLGVVSTFNGFNLIALP